MRIKRVYNLTQPELEDIVNLHLEMLHDSFLNNLGKNFLRIVYSDLGKNKKNIFLVLKKQDNVIGYLVATKDSASFTPDIIKSKFPELSFEILKASVKKPLLILKIAKWLAIPKLKEDHPAELLFIAIDKKEQLKGYGTKLISQLYKDLKNDKVEFLKVGTKSDNPYSNAFYKKLNFKFLQKKIIFDDDFNYYLSPKIF